ncbi:hypothetical protein PCANC_28415 [Puccinia coronata f. sp. avenae]|uniref:Uncharacterized protein n=1 Tax=Puccinia coronata f. sp. avenae TaxID=200324 RepID=A0A2N5TI84_9BASI|nr:hypothetical protein PCANC_28415 [Puccinia coronata f. sp. avenae]
MLTTSLSIHYLSSVQFRPKNTLHPIKRRFPKAINCTTTQSDSQERQEAAAYWINCPWRKKEEHHHTIQRGSNHARGSKVPKPERTLPCDMALNERVILVCGHLKPPLPLLGLSKKDMNPCSHSSILHRLCSPILRLGVNLLSRIQSFEYQLNLRTIQIAKYEDTTVLFFLYSNIYSSQH